MLSPRAVIFDFGGVLCHHPSEDRFARIAGLFNISTLDLLQIFWANRLAYDAGKLDAAAYWRHVAVSAGQPFDESQLPTLKRYEVELWQDYDERILGWVAHLQAHGIRTGILSNLPSSIGESLRATPGFLDPFDHVTFSYELGIVKPQPAIYRHALQGVDVLPEEALFLDDKPENIEGARAVGLLGEVYSSWEDFLADVLKRYDLPPPAAAS